MMTIDGDLDSSEGMESLADNASEQGPDSVENLVPEDVLDSESLASGDGEDTASDRLEERRTLRRRRRIMEGLATSFGLTDEEAIRAFEMVEEMLPDPDRMSTAEHVGDRLEQALGDLRHRHPRLVFTRNTKNPIDTTDPKRFFAENEAFAGLLESEEGLLRAVMVNDRAMFGMHRWMAEHEAVRAMLLTELVRRSTLVEQWRHMLPKYMLPIFSMIQISGAKAGELRPDTRLFNRLRDAIIEWSGGKVSREVLMTAARRTEDEFASVLAKGEAGVEPVSESFDACRQRLSFVLEEARRDEEELIAIEADAEDVEASERKVRRLIMVLGLDGGIDRDGRLVFPSVEAFAERTRAVAPSRRNDMRTDLGGDDKVGAGTTGETNASGDDGHEVVPDASGDIPAGEGVPVSVGPVSEVIRDGVHQDDSKEDDDVLNGDDGFGPDIPDDLFGTEPGVDEGDADDAGEQAGTTTGSEHSVASEPGSQTSVDQEPEPVAIPPAPIGEEHTIFSPGRLKDWPTSISEVQALVPSLPRSTGLSRSTSDAPFRSWTPLPDRIEFCFVGFRRHPDLSARAGIEGPIEPADLSRVELGAGEWRGLIRDQFSPVLGQGHPLMLPPHSSLAWYGRKLGWGESDVRQLSLFGSPARPESIVPKGDVRKLLDALRGVSRLRLDELAGTVPGHFLSDNASGEDRRREAFEDLARWWLFLLVARHRQAEFDMLLPGGFFHGVHGPDFVIDAGGRASFGSAGNASHLGLWSVEMRRKLEQAGPNADPAALGIGAPYSGPRRMMA